MGRMIGKTVVLREYRREDLSAIRSWINDGGTTRYLGGSFRRPQSWEQTEEMLERRLNGDVGGEGFVIADRESMAYLGQCDLMMIDNVARRAEIAVVLVPEARGRGAAFEGLSLLLSYAFDTLNLNRVWLRCAAENAPAISLYERLGFRREGILREDLFIDGHAQDAIVMGLLRSEFSGGRV